MRPDPVSPFLIRKRPLPLVRSVVIGLLMVCCQSPAAMAQTGERIAVPAEAMAAFDRREYGQAASLIVPAFDACRAERPEGEACADLAMAAALLVAVAGNDKVEQTILDARDYIDTHVGPDTRDALAVVSAMASYYDRMLDMGKMLPVAERRLALARKLFGPVAHTSVIAAVSLCIVQWNLGQGQAAVDLLSPLAGQLPEDTPEQMTLSARVHDCMGTAYYSMDNNRDAETAFRKALALFERGVGETNQTTLDTMASLANTLRRLNRDGEARALATRIESLAPLGSPVLGRIDWARTAADPIEAARQELARTEKAFGADSPVADMAGASLAVELINAGRFAEAEPYLARLAAAANSEDNPDSVRIKLLIGQVALLTTIDGGSFGRALPVIEQLVALAKRTGAASDKLLIDFQMYAGALLNAGGESRRAYSYLTDAGRLLIARISSYRDFDADAQGEMKEYSPVFRFSVATAWRLSRGG